VLFQAFGYGDAAGAGTDDARDGPVAIALETLIHAILVIYVVCQLGAFTVSTPR
jgi:hypothetical protein